MALLVSTDVAAVDPPLEAADSLSIVATAIAGLSLGWRRGRPVTAFVVFVAGCLVVTLTGSSIAVYAGLAAGAAAHEQASGELVTGFAHGCFHLP